MKLTLDKVVAGYTALQRIGGEKMPISNETIGANAGKIIKINGLGTDVEFVTQTEGGAAAWGGITGTLSAQTDLVGVLDGCNVG